jgi:hypothetical protein
MRAGRPGGNDSTFLLPVAPDFDVQPDKNDFRSVKRAEIPFCFQKYMHDRLIVGLEFNPVTYNAGFAATSFAID